MKSKTYRTNGAFGALLDEYEKSIDELISVIKEVSIPELTTIVDHKTTDEDCQSIQHILSHVVQSGYTYALETRKWQGESIVYKDKILLSTTNEYISTLKEMFAFNEKLFEDYPNLTVTEYQNEKKINVRWGQQYDVEQLFEHAIVHILRHRRQIEKFIEQLRFS